MPEKWSSAWIWPLAVVFASMVAGMYGWFQLGWRRQVGVAALTVLLFNAALHSLWGSNELYLYVLHWQPALLILLAGAAYLRQRLALVPAILLLGTEIVMNADHLRFMLAKLGG